LKKKYDLILKPLKAQLLNIKKTTFLWNLTGTWILTFKQDVEKNKNKLSEFTAEITITHNNNQITGNGKLTTTYDPNRALTLDNDAVLDCSSFIFTLLEKDLVSDKKKDLRNEKTTNEEKGNEEDNADGDEEEEDLEENIEVEEEDADIGDIADDEPNCPSCDIFTMVAINGESFNGTWEGFQKNTGIWCSGSGTVKGELKKEKN